MTIWENEDPKSKGTILGRLVQTEEEIKEVQLKAAIGEKGEKEPQ